MEWNHYIYAADHKVSGNGNSTYNLELLPVQFILLKNVILEINVHFHRNKFIPTLKILPGIISIIITFNNSRNIFLFTSQTIKGYINKFSSLL